MRRFSVRWGDDESQTLAIEMASIPMANVLWRLEMERFRFQFSISGPNSWCSWIQRCHFGDDRAKHHPLKRINGVVGSRGRNRPAKPSPRLISPTSLRNMAFADEFSFTNLSLAAFKRRRKLMLFGLRLGLRFFLGVVLSDQATDLFLRLVSHAKENKLIGILAFAVLRGGTNPSPDSIFGRWKRR